MVDEAERQLSVSVSDARDRAWVNDSESCIARISSYSGFEIYKDGAMVAFKIGHLSADDFTRFQDLMFEHHGLVIEDELVVVQ